MINIRLLDYQQDRLQLGQLDTSFTTNRRYRVSQSGLSFNLLEETIDPPIHKDYRLADDLGTLEDMAFAVIAEENAVIKGLAAVKPESWNRRAVIWHLYVARDCRGRGVGTTLINACLEYANRAKARCLWLETQNINYPAIRFYQKMGFEFCGLDTALYDAEQIGSDEVALFFAKWFV